MMNKCTVFAFLIATAGLLAQAPEMQPFPMDWRDNSAAVVDLSPLLDAPAGKHGFIRVQDGHLAAGGQRFRIWAFNFAGAATVPPKADAPAIAAHLARLGVNCIRFHHMDRLAPAGLVAADRNDTRLLDPGQLDRLDFFISELKKRGIYANLNLNVSRRYKPDDGVLDHELIGYAKALTYFDPRLIELQREYAKQLLTHRNPYTRSEYRSEPAVLMVEMVNENSIVESWAMNRLQGKSTVKNPPLWTDIPPSYEKQLTERYNAWLAQRLPAAELKKLRAMAGVEGDAPLPRLRREEFAKAPAVRFRTEASFYVELEQAFFRSMAAYLRDELGVKSLLAGTSDHNHAISGYPLLRSTSQLDIVDGHTYWQHPSIARGGGIDGRSAFTIPNTPMVNEPFKSTVVELSRSAVAGKPYTVSEVNHPFPNEYASEGVPILAAYAAFQDWDGVFWYTFDESPTSEWKSVQRGYFNLRADPVKMTQLAAGALTFLRQDVRPAEQTVRRSYSAAQVYESIRLPQTERPYFTPGFPLSVPLRHASRIAAFDGAETAPPQSPDSDPIVSDTKELTWRRDGGGLVTVDSPRLQAIAGFCAGNRATLAHLSADVKNRFCAITVSSLDNVPLARSRRMLLGTAARVANTGMQWAASRNTLTDWGTAPTMIEPVVGTVTLAALPGARQVRATALDGGGRPLGKPVMARNHDGRWEIPVGRTATPWYLIEVKR